MYQNTPSELKFLMVLISTAMVNNLAHLENSIANFANMSA